MPYKWSRRWYAGAPVGTVAYLGGGMADVSLGDGKWETVSVDEAEERYRQAHRLAFAWGGGRRR